MFLSIVKNAGKVDQAYKDKIINWDYSEITAGSDSQSESYREKRDFKGSEDKYNSRSDSNASDTKDSANEKLPIIQK